MGSPQPGKGSGDTGREGDWPCPWPGATYVKARRDHQIAPVAIIVASGANTDARREALGMATGRSEAEPSWVEFLRGLARRGWPRPPGPGRGQACHP